MKLADARTNNRVWQTQPDQQLMYHGVRVWARRHTPELMLGVYSPEEFDEKPKGPPVPAPNVMQHAHPFNPEVLGHDPTTGEITQSAVDDGDTPPSAPTTADAAPPALSTGGAAQISIEDMARNAAARGEDVFRTFYRNRSGPEQARVNAIGDELREIMDAVPKQE